jgi:hypothetical protein
MYQTMQSFLIQVNWMEEIYLSITENKKVANLFQKIFL